MYSPTYGSITLTPGFPSDYSGRLLQEARLFSWVNSLGSILLQEVEGRFYRLRYFVFHFQQPAILKAKEEEEEMQSLLALKGSMHYAIQGLPEFHLRNHQFMLLQADHRETKIVIPGGKECHIWNTYYTGEAYREWLSIFPKLPQRVPKSKPFYYLSRPRPAHPAALEAVHRQLETPYDEPYNRIHYEGKIREALFGHLVQAHSPVEMPELSIKERNAAVQAHDIIVKDVSAHYSNIELARRVGLNEAQLKKAFRVLYGLGMFAYLRKLRFEKARELILVDKLPTEEVGPKIGYTRISEFIKEFTKYYGYSPRALGSGEAG